MSNKFKLLRDKSEGNLSNMNKSNGFGLFLEDETKVEERFDRQELLVGSSAK